MNRLVLPALALAAGCVVRAGPMPAHSHAPGPHEPPPVAVQSPPPAPPHADVVAPHPTVAMDAGGASSVAQSWAHQRGWRSKVTRVDRVGNAWVVEIKIHGEAKGHARVQVDAFTGALAVVEESVRPHDRGRHGGRDDDD